MSDPIPVPAAVDVARVLAAPMLPGNDAGAATVRDYLVALLAMVWEEEEGFSGKRPFGNSGWKADFDAALVRAGLVAGEFDADGCLETCDDELVDELVVEAIWSLGAGGGGDAS